MGSSKNLINNLISSPHKILFPDEKEESGGGGSSAPAVPDYAAEQAKREAEAQKKKAALAGQGMSGAILGGGLGNESDVKKKKLLGE